MSSKSATVTEMTSSCSLNACSNPHSSVFVAAQPQTSNICVVGQLPLPYCIPMNSIQESLKAELNEGLLLTTGQRTELLQALYQDVTKYTL